MKQNIKITSRLSIEFSTHLFFAPSHADGNQWRHTRETSNLSRQLSSFIFLFSFLPPFVPSFLPSIDASQRHTFLTPKMAASLFFFQTDITAPEIYLMPWSPLWCQSSKTDDTVFWGTLYYSIRIFFLQQTLASKKIIPNTHLLSFPDRKVD